MASIGSIIGVHWEMSSIHWQDVKNITQEHTWSISLLMYAMLCIL